MENDYPDSGLSDILDGWLISRCSCKGKCHELLASHFKIDSILTSHLTLSISFVEFPIHISSQPKSVAAHTGDVFGPACGKPTIDGEVNSAEWSTASQKTFFMQGANPSPLTATLYVMNSANNLYLGLTIDDDEFSTVGQFLSKGDGFRIDFDNDHSGTLFALGDEVLGSNAGQPQFNDLFIDGSPVPSSSDEDVNNGGTIDGSSVASRVVNDNHFEVQHPLCSGDSRDFCLQNGDVVGFRLEYLDAEANGDFGGSYFFPGATNTSEADIVIGDCDIPDMYTYIPATCKGASHSGSATHLIIHNMRVTFFLIR